MEVRTHGTQAASRTTTAEPEAPAETLEAAVRRLGDWWPCFDVTISEPQARGVAATRLGVSPEMVEVLPTGGGILCRKLFMEAV